MAKIKFTKGEVEGFKCAEGVAQSFLWCDLVPGLAVRATPNGKNTYIFQAKVEGKTMRKVIGKVAVWDIDAAKAEARRLQVLIDQDNDPRQVEADKAAAKAHAKQAKAAATAALSTKAAREAVTVAHAWAEYIANPPKKKGKTWGERHLRDHEKLMLPERIKGEGSTARTLTAGVLASLAPLPLSALTPERVGAWLEEETPRRATQAALAFRLLRAFINWCNERNDYKDIASPDACARKVSGEHLTTSKSKEDGLRREKLKLWFDSVRRIPNPTIAAYLQGLLITGARRNELTGLRWEEVDFQWNSITIRDKVEGERTIPLTPYLASLLRDLQRKNEQSPTVRRLDTLKEQGRSWSPSPWVFSSQTSATGRLEEPSIAHRKAVTAAGLPPVSLHGLRRSFASLAEWVEVPAGVVAQIMGHKPSAIAEKHYIRRPLDLLSMWHTKIEGWILSEAGIQQPKQNEKPVLRSIAS
jgi:integrase